MPRTSLSILLLILGACGNGNGGAQRAAPASTLPVPPTNAPATAPSQGPLSMPSSIATTAVSATSNLPSNLQTATFALG